MGNPSETKSLNLCDGVTLRLSYIPSGYFRMGTDNVRASLSSYYLGTYPVTVRQFKCFIDANGYNDESLWSPSGWRWRTGYSFEPPESSKDQQKLDHPQVGINWYEAFAFCRWLSQSCGYGVSLPNEMEWEKAARGSDGRKYPWGDIPPTSSRCNFDNYYALTTPVGSFPAGNSPYNCSDMAGNVWEWCRNSEGPIPYDDAKSREDPDTRNLVTARGGSFMSPAQELYTWYRSFNFPMVRLNQLGFRIVMYE
jgi:formylglycine-generating enzyme required for sulfatase activity